MTAVSRSSRASAASYTAAPVRDAAGTRRAAALWWIAAAVLLLAGYADLWLGGTELASVLLVAGYAVCVPMALTRGVRAGSREGAAFRPSYGAAGVASLVVFVLYLLTLAPTTAMWDTSEYIAAIRVLGLPHPPGNPFFVLLGHVFGMLPIAPTYAQRINVMAALCSALTAGTWFLVTERVLVEWLPQRWLRITGGALAALVSATAFTVWNQSVVNEKVYTVSLVGFAIVAWLIVRWCDEPDTPGANRLLVLIAYLMGLGYAVHPAGFLVGPAAVVAVLARRPSTLLRWRLVVAGLGALLLGLTPFAFEPIRAAHFPVMNEGETTACTTHIEVGCTFSKLTAERLKANINREQYQKPPVVDRQAPFGRQVGMYWLYFEWQWLRDVAIQHPGVQGALAAIFLALGLLGGWVHWQRDRRSFWFFGPLMLTLTLGLIYYLNFKLGWTQAQRLGLGFDPNTTEVRDRDYFYLWSFSAWGVWIALGLVLVWETLASAFAGPRARTTTARAGARAGTIALPGRSWAMAAPVLAIALVPLFGNWSAASRAGETFTREWAHDMLESVEPYGILITNGDNDTFPLWYAQEVEGIRQDVIVAVGSYLGTDWFVRQLIRRPVRPYDAAKGPAIYRGREWPAPKGPPLKMSFEQADAIPQYIELPQRQYFQHGQITAAVGPGYLTRDQLIVLRFIQDAFPERPIYFSAGGYAQSLGLTPYVLTQGLVQKLMPAPVQSTRATPPMPSGHLDVERSWQLWSTVYRAPEALVRQGRWVDRASVDIPVYYIVSGSYLAAGLQQEGRTAEAQKMDTLVRQMTKAAGLEAELGGGAAPVSGGDR